MNKYTLRLPQRHSICVEKRSVRTNVLTFISKNDVEVKLNKSQITQFLECKNEGSTTIVLDSQNLYITDKISTVIIVLKGTDKKKCDVDFEVSRKDFRKLCRIMKEVFLDV